MRLVRVAFRPLAGRMAAVGEASKKPKGLADAALFPHPAGSAPPSLVDIGANLGDDAFAGDLGEVLARARAAGVGRVVITGTSLARSAAALQLAQRHAGCFSTAGVHPHDAATWEGGSDGASAAALRALLSSPLCVALGECGLDFCRDFCLRAAQEAALVAQLDLAARLAVPLFLHCRDAHDRLVELLAPRLRAADGEGAEGLGGSAPPPRLTAPVVVHCFTGTAAEAAQLVSLSPLVHIGFTGWLCDPREGRAEGTALAARAVPLDRLLLETDAPYLVPRWIAPAKARPSRNEPALLPWVAHAVAQAKGLSLHQVAQQTTANAERVFGLPTGVNVDSDG